MKLGHCGVLSDMCLWEKIIFGFLPQREPLITKDSELYFVPVFAFGKNMIFEDSLYFVATLFAIPFTPTVKPNDRRADFAKVECVEDIVEKDHFGLGSVALTPESFLSEQGSCCCLSILPVDVVDTYNANRITIEHDSEHDIGLLSFIE